MWDERSFDARSFDVRSWLMGIGQAIAGWITSARRRLRR